MDSKRRRCGSTEMRCTAYPCAVHAGYLIFQTPAHAMSCAEHNRAQRTGERSQSRISMLRISACLRSTDPWRTCNPRAQRQRAMSSGRFRPAEIDLIGPTGFSRAAIQHKAKRPLFRLSVGRGLFHTGTETTRRTPCPRPLLFQQLDVRHFPALVQDCFLGAI